MSLNLWPSTKNVLEGKLLSLQFPNMAGNLFIAKQEANASMDGGDETRRWSVNFAREREQGIVNRSQAFSEINFTWFLVGKKLLLQ